MYYYIISIEILLSIILSIAFLTLFERKVLAYIQRRVGPNIVGIYGLLQPLFDGIKLILKESIIPIKSNKINYLIAPIIILFISLILYIIIPFNNNIIIFDNYFSILFIFAISSLSIYGILIGGFYSNNKYSLIGSLRSTSQLIAYEVSIGFILINVILLNNSLNLIDIIYSQIYIWNLLVLFPIYILLFISILAETNRTPFDLLEAESELVAGFMTEYSGIVFVFYYLGEYCAILFLSLLLNILFFGSINIIFILILFKIIWIRATLPRLRYDQLIYLGWMCILPLSITYYIVILTIYFIFNL